MPISLHIKQKNMLINNSLSYENLLPCMYFKLGRRCYSVGKKDMDFSQEELKQWHIGANTLSLNCRRLVKARGGDSSTPCGTWECASVRVWSWSSIVWDRLYKKIRAFQVTCTIGYHLLGSWSVVSGVKNLVSTRNWPLELKELYINGT